MIQPIYVIPFNAHYVCVLNHIMLWHHELCGIMLKLIDKLILLCDSFEILWWTKCDIIKYKNLLAIIKSYNKIK